MPFLNHCRRAEAKSWGRLGSDAWDLRVVCYRVNELTKRNLYLFVVIPLYVDSRLVDPPKSLMRTHQELEARVGIGLSERPN